MGRIAAAIRENAQEIGRLEHIDHGWPIKELNGMAFRAASSFEWVAQAAGSLMTGDIVPADSNTLAYVKREPVGVSPLLHRGTSP